jgi:NADPH-dependent curcumin reductase CurA
MSYNAIKLVKRPFGNITPDCFELCKIETPVLQNGEFLVQQTHMSLDPAMRGWMMEDKDSYMPRVELGEVMRSSGVGEIIESKNVDYPIGSRVMGMMGWTERYVGVSESLRVLPEGLPTEAALCVLAPGLAAYHGLVNVGKPKPEETLFISGAAGAVGSLVGQIAKAEGLTVIGSAGSDEKCRWLTEDLGFDAAINYKSEALQEPDALLTQVQIDCPSGIDLYFENTGGPIQHAVFDTMNAHGRIIVCGMIADYNSEIPSHGPNWLNIIKKRLSIQGFTMPDHFDQIPEMMVKISEYLMAGKIQYRSHELSGLESAIAGINLLFSGDNKGKLLVRL